MQVEITLSIFWFCFGIYMVKTANEEHPKLLLPVKKKVMDSARHFLRARNRLERGFRFKSSNATIDTELICDF